jgi:multiple sugar transport system substrate-binding protein
MRTRLLAVAAAVTLALATAACGGRTAGDTGGWRETGEITYWMWDASQLPAYQQCALDFEARNPDIDVNIEQIGWDDYWGRLLTSFVADAAPDVFVDHTSRYGDFTARGLLEPIDELVARDGPDLGQYLPGTADLWIGDDGRRYGLPKDVDAVALFYNKELAAAAGITDEQMQNLTWNPVDGGTYEDVIARLSVDRNGVRGDEPGFDRGAVATYGLGLNRNPSWHGQSDWSFLAATLGWTYTDRPLWGTRFHFDDPRYLDTIRWWRGLIEKGYMPPLELTVGGQTSQQLQAGLVAMASAGSWEIPNFAKLGGISLATAPTPIGPGGTRASMSNSIADSIAAGSPNKGAAWKWVRYLASPECQSVVARGGVVIPAIANEMPAAEARLAEWGLDISAFTRHIHERTGFLFPAIHHSEEVDTIMQRAVQRVLSFGAEPESLSEANEQVNALFQQG